MSNKILQNIMIMIITVNHFSQISESVCCDIINIYSVNFMEMKWKKDQTLKNTIFMQIAQFIFIFYHLLDVIPLAFVSPVSQE